MMDIETMVLRKKDRFFCTQQQPIQYRRRYVALLFSFNSFHNKCVIEANERQEPGLQKMVP